MAIGISAFQTLYQTYYPDNQLKYLTPTSAVLLNMFLADGPDTSVSGDVVDMPWLIGPSTGVSQSYTAAAGMANNAPASLRPVVRMSQIYKNLSFLDKDDILSRGDASYGELMETVVKGAREDFLSNVDMLLHGNGSGNIAAFTWASATATVLTLLGALTQLTSDTGAKLSSPVGQTIFEKNDQVYITSKNPNDGTQPTIVSGPHTVTAVDGNANSITVSPAPTTADLSNGNTYGLAKVGNTLGFNSSLVNPNLIGVAAFNPYGGPTSGESFLGVDRSVYGTRAAGTWLDASTSYSFDQAIRKVATGMKNTGVAAGGLTASLAPDDYDSLDFKMTAQNRYGSHQLGEVFFESIGINSTMGRINTVVDTHQQKGQTRLYAPGAAKLMYRNGLPHFATLENGLSEQWGSNYDGREKRMRAYLQLRVTDPRKLAVGALPASI